MKKSYIKPTVFVEHLAMKSSISTCGFVSTAKIEDDVYTCHKQFYDPTHEGGLCEEHKGSLGSVPTYVPEDGSTLVCSGNGTCEWCYECYHVPVPGGLDGTNSKYYIGIS